MRLLASFYCVWAVGLAAAGPVAAQDIESMIRQGVELRRQGKDVEALAVFRAATAIQRAPHAVAQAALAEQALGLWTEGESDFKEALAATDDPWIRKNHKALEEAQRVVAGHLGGLLVWGTPTGAELAIDGKIVGTLPQIHELRWAVGSAKLTARAPGYLETTRTIEISTGGHLREHVELEPAPKAPEISLAAPAAPPPSVVVTSEATEPRDQPESSSGHPVYKRWWFWTAIGVVAVGATVSVLLLRPKSSGCDSGVTCGTWGGGS